MSYDFCDADAFKCKFFITIFVEMRLVFSRILPTFFPIFICDENDVFSHIYAENSVH